MKLGINAIWLICVALSGCAAPASAEKADRMDADDQPGSFIVRTGDDARQVLAAVPAESAMERFHLIDAEGHLVSYVAFTETDIGGLVFVDRKLLGTVSKRDAQAFYDCRGYVTTTRQHWAQEASEWSASLLAASVPANRVTLRFSGNSTSHSIQEVNKDQTEMLLSLLNFSVNPINILKKLNAARESMREREQYAKTLRMLSAIAPGDSEAQVAATLEPEDVLFDEKGLVLAYPGYAYEYYVSEGVVRVAQQPSFYRVSRSRPALFYVNGMKWEFCTPKHWREALPELKPAGGQAAE